MFINQKFNAYLSNTFDEVMADYFMDHDMWSDDLTDWEYDIIHEQAVNAAYVNRSLVLQRQHGVPGEHDFQLGYCHNMTI